MNLSNHLLRNALNSLRSKGLFRYTPSYKVGDAVLISFKDPILSQAAYSERTRGTVTEVRPNQGGPGKHRYYVTNPVWGTYGVYEEEVCLAPTVTTHPPGAAIFL